MKIEPLQNAEESQARLAAIVESSDDAIIGKTLDGVMTSWNAGAERLFGYSAREAIGKSILLIVPADRRDEEAEILSRLRCGEAIRSFETIRIAKDGTALHVSVTASPIRDRTGTVIGASKIARNITARMRAENDIKESQLRLQGIIASAMDAIVTVDDQQRVTLFNAAAERMFGCLASEAIGQTLDRFLPQQYREIHREHIRAFGEAGVTTRAMSSQRPLTALRSDGAEFPVEATISQITIAGHTLYTAIVRDITERRRAEEALRESAGRLLAIFDTAVDCIITIDDRGHITSFNPAATRIFGYTPPEVLDCNINMLMPAPYHDEHDRYLNSYITTGAKKIIGIGREVMGRRKDGTLFPMELAVSETRLGDRRIFTGIVRDVSERKRAEANMALQAEELARSNVELERFAFVASHDLQEPMRTVQCFAQLLQRGYGETLAGEGAEYLQFITDGVMRMQTLINDLLAYSRINSQGAAFAPADCNEICAMVMKNLQASVESNQAKVTIDPLPVVIGDATQLGQMFQNLLVNAIKFHGERTPCIRVSAKEASSEWVFSITDNGIGIPAEHFDRIFIIFKRLHSIEEYGGTGIGLAICKKIAERHNGRIWLNSTVGEGSTFHFSIQKRGKTT